MGAPSLRGFTRCNRLGVVLYSGLVFSIVLRKPRVGFDRNAGAGPPSSNRLAPRPPGKSNLDRWNAGGPGSEAQHPGPGSEAPEERGTTPAHYGIGSGSSATKGTAVPVTQLNLDGLLISDEAQLSGPPSSLLEDVSLEQLGDYGACISIF